MTDLMIVVSGLIVRNGRLLLIQRSARSDFPFAWESPGGKVEKGEMDSVALRREIQEELGVVAEVLDTAPVYKSVWRPPQVPKGCEVRLYRCYIAETDVPELREGQFGMGWFLESEVPRLYMMLGNAIVARAAWEGLVHPELCSYVWADEHGTKERFTCVLPKALPHGNHLSKTGVEAQHHSRRVGDK